MGAIEQLKAIEEEVAVCTACKLHLSRKLAVPGAGSPDADIMFIGEAPGFHENEQGVPFVGAAGRFLDELLATIDLQREDVFICNVVKCRPPGNRDPQLEEMEACQGYLNRQINAIQPKVIVTLGRFSMARYFPNAKISQIHGQPKMANGRLIVPMYHPAAALHQPSLRQIIEEDFLRLPDFIDQAGSLAVESAPLEEPPEQLSLF